MANMNNTADYKENTAEITQIELLCPKLPNMLIIVLNTKMIADLQCGETEIQAMTTRHV